MSIFQGSPATRQTTLDPMLQLDGDQWFMNAAAQLGGFDVFLTEEKRIAEVVAEIEDPLPSFDVQVLAALIVEGSNTDVIAAAERAVDLERAHKARGLVRAAVEAARDNLAGGAAGWVRRNEGDLCALLHAERSATAASIRDLVARLDGVDDLEVLARRPELAALVAEMAPLVGEWRAQRRRHHAITGLTPDTVEVRNGEFTHLRFPHLDWASEYDEAWPAFYALHRDRAPIEFPWGDASILEVGILLTAFPKVWTPTAGEFLRARAQLTREAQRLAHAEAKAREAQQKQGPARQEFEDPMRVIHPPEHTPHHALAHTSRRD